MADPLDIFTRNAIAAAIGRPVTVAVAVPIELEAALERLYAELARAAMPRRCSTRWLLTPSRRKRMRSG